MELLIACTAALLAAAGWALGTLLFERFMSSQANAPSAAACNLFKNGVAGSVFLLVAWITGASAVPSDAWGVLLLSGVLGFAIGDTCTFAALPRCGVQLTALLGNLIPLLSGLLAWFFLDESLSLLTIGSMVVVVLGVSLVITGGAGARNANDKDGSERRLGILLAILAALSQAVAIVVGRHGFQGVDVFPGTVARICGGLGGAFILALLMGFRSKGGPVGELRELTRPLRSTALMRGLLLPTFCAAVLILPLHSLALRGAPGGVAAALLATTPLFTLPLGLAFGVRPTRRTVVGTVIGFLGAVGTIVGTS